MFGRGSCFRSKWCVVEGGYVWFDVGTEFLGAISHVEGHGLEGGVVGEVIVGEGAVGVDLSEGEENDGDGEDEEDEGGERAVAVLHHRYNNVSIGYSSCVRTAAAA